MQLGEIFEVLPAGLVDAIRSIARSGPAFEKVLRLRSQVSKIVPRVSMRLSEIGWCAMAGNDGLRLQQLNPSESFQPVLRSADR
ncbi:MAG: hypothetical protein ACREUZ_19075, partial [Burkholderiales bacterium]